MQAGNRPAGQGRCCFDMTDTRRPRRRRPLPLFKCVAERYLSDEQVAARLREHKQRMADRGQQAH